MNGSSPQTSGQLPVGPVDGALRRGMANLNAKRQLSAFCPNQVRSAHVVCHAAAERAIHLLCALNSLRMLIALCIAWLLSFSAHAQTTVIQYGDAWKFAIPVTDPGTHWRGGVAAYDESAWSEGHGLFGFETAPLPAPGLRTITGTEGSPHMVYLFSKTFTYDGPLSGARIAIDEIVDDGVTWYLNGNLIGSWQHVPGAWNNAAVAPGVENAEEVINAVSGAATGLIVGTNVLAAEVHQKGAGNSDLAFGARVRINLPPQSSADWRMQYFETTSNASVAADLFDADHDGLANLLEYALATNPSVQTSEWAQTTFEGADLVFRYLRRKAALAEVELTHVGAPTPAGPWTSLAATAQITGEDDAVQFVTLRVPVSGATARYVKLQATRTAFPGMALQLSAATQIPVPVGTAATFSAGVNSGSATYLWNFGDGTTLTTATGTASHLYAAPGHYQIIVRAVRGSESQTVAFTQTVHFPLTTTRPVASSPIIIDHAQNRVWNVNPDANTVTAIDAVSLTKQFEKPVGLNPRSLAQAPDGTVWVTNHKSATISVLARTTGDLLANIALPYGSRPQAVAFSPDGSFACVSLEGSGRLLKLNPTTRAITGDLDVGPTPRGIAITHDSQRVLVTRFISPTSEGQVTEVSANPFALTRVFHLAQDTTAIDGDSAARGVPNYLAGIAISPDGRGAWVASKKDNTLRGPVRDGLPLTFESTVRTMTAQLDLKSNTELAAGRVDFNNRDSAFAVAFTPKGDYAFVALQGSNSVAIRDAYDKAAISALETDLAPQGLAVNQDGSRLFVMNFMSRTVRVFDITGITNSTDLTSVTLASIPTVANELLTPQVLLGKQVFYNSKDSRMSRDGYISCASCHADGGHDGRVWDFTDRGEGLRNTTTLLGRSGMGHGRVHWTGNFDEIQDFENDIRNNFGGTGFMSDTQFHTGTRSTTLGDPKAGLSPELDALAAYVTSLSSIEPSPYRSANGSLTADAVAGQQIFQQLNCAACHSGAQFTDSPAGVLHDVGTIQPTSGKRMGATLTGLDTPSLRGVWSTAPYLHDGSAPTLLDVLNRAAAQPAQLHGPVGTLTPTQRQQLAAYLQQLE